MIATDTIDFERLLTDGIIAAGEYFPVLSSTQDRAMERARGEAPRLPHLVVADDQTAGRGRGQNRWWTGPGSLAFSLVFDPVRWADAPEALPARSLAVGVAIVETLAPLVPGKRVGLHWPNDVYVDGRKIAGVLVDVLGGAQHVVGIGINVNNPLAAAPDDVRARAASLCELAGRQFDRTALLADLLLNLHAAVRDSAASPEAFGRRFGELCLQMGQQLTIDVAGRQTTGRCEGIQPDGTLVLATPQGREVFYSGVVVHR